MMAKKKLRRKKSGDVISSWDWDTLSQVLYRVGRIVETIPTIHYISLDINAFDMVGKYKLELNVFDMRR